MEKKINFIFVIHCHQPVGNFDSVFEDSYQKSYLPLLQVVEGHPKIKLTLHFSGILLEWIVKNHPDFIEILKRMCRTGQVEMMGGGFYEPVLAILNDHDKKGQIKKLTKYIKHHLDSDARGMWLTERVWEPHLAKPITEADQEYIILDDHHFRRAGVPAEDLRGYFITEEQGNVLKVLPGSEALRYLMPFHNPEETIVYLKKMRDEMGIHYIAMADDGEKFGVWPGTYKLVYEDGWLDDFFTLVEENLSWIEPSTCSEYLDSHKPVGTAYFPTCSYREMDEWVLPLHMNQELSKVTTGQYQPKEIGELLQAGIWRNFLVKYPEANQLHKKMMYLSNKIGDLKEAAAKLKLSASKNKNIEAALEEIIDEIWKGQCNDVYWHGIFGGLYLPHMRTALYTSLVTAETMMERFVESYLPPKAFPEYRNLPAITKGDYNYDLNDEYLINTGDLLLYCDPENGGTIYECGFKPNGFNLMSTLARREEAYHNELLSGMVESGGEVTTIHGGIQAKESGLEKFLCFDKHEKRSLMDIFLHSGTTFESYKNSTYEEIGNFAVSIYDDTTNKDNKSLSLSRSALVNNHMVKVSKTILPAPEKGGVYIDYRIENMSGNELEFIFGTEFNINLLAGDAHDRYYSGPDIEIEDNKLASSGVIENISKISLTDEWMKMAVHIESNKPFTLWRMPVETVSSSESGLEKVYQSSSVFPHWELRLNPSKVFDFKILFAIESI